MKIVAFEVTREERRACLGLQPPHEVACVEEPLTAELADSYCDAEVVATFIRSDLTEAALRRLPNLRLIATRSTGFDHIDLDYCRKASVVVCNVPDYGDHTVAEHAFALLLAISRHIVEAAERTRKGDFSQAGLQGFDLAGKVLGVIGAGRIGRRVIAIGKGFGMEIIAFDVRPDPAAAQTLGFRYAPLEGVLSEADVISLHVPGGPETRHLLSESEFGLMKPGAVVINTSRGGVIDATALVRGLTSGRLAGAGLDVVAEESALVEEAELFRDGADLTLDQLRALLADHALLDLPHVVVTPHIAYDSREAAQRIMETTIANIASYAAGKPQNVVT
jgi:D-lactate dehydrogenase